MNVELATDLYLKKLFARLLPARNAFIEVGLGSDNYSFRWAAPMGFQCRAVEPLPTETLVAQAGRHAVPLFRGALAGSSGPVGIFLGEIEGRHLPDYSSLHPEWWGCGSRKETVAALTLQDYIRQEGITAISCLKIDTEGSEPAILGGLGGLQEALLPEVIVFEYGGCTARSEGLGGWSPAFFNGTLECLRAVVSAGYQRLLLLEQADDLPRWADIQTTADFGGLFKETCIFGNLLCIRRPLDAASMQPLDLEVRAALRRDARMDAIRKIARSAKQYVPPPVRRLLRRLLHFGK